MVWVKETLSFKADFSQGFPTPPTQDKKASILEVAIVMKVFVGLCWLLRSIQSNGEVLQYDHSGYCLLPRIIKSFSIPYLLQEAGDTCQNLIRQARKIPSRTKALKIISQAIHNVSKWCHLVEVWMRVLHDATLMLQNRIKAWMGVKCGTPYGDKPKDTTRTLFVGGCFNSGKEH